MGKKFGIPLIDDQEKPKKALEVVGELAQGMLDHLTNARLIAGPKAQGKPTYRIRIDNASPLILNGLALAGPDKSEGNSAGGPHWYQSPPRTGA